MSMEAPFFLLGLSLLLVHELDAGRCHEWRMFPGLSALSDRWGLGNPRLRLESPDSRHGALGPRSAPLPAGR